MSSLWLALLKVQVTFCQDRFLLLQNISLRDSKYAVHTGFFYNESILESSTVFRKVIFLKSFFLITLLNLVFHRHRSASSLPQKKLTTYEATYNLLFWFSPFSIWHSTVDRLGSKMSHGKKWQLLNQGNVCLFFAYCEKMKRTCQITIFLSSYGGEWR